MGHFWDVNWFGYTVHLNTLIMLWAAMLVVLALSWRLTRSLALIPSRSQIVGESVFDLCRSITMSAGGQKGDRFLVYIGSVFLLILAANLMGQLPLKLIRLEWFGGHGELIAATGDLNVPLGLALCTAFMYFFLGFKWKGLSYLKHYLHPSPLFLPMHLIEEITRPGSLTIRLYCNILVGEILSFLAMSIMPYVAPVAVILIELFVAVVQAYIFAILSAVYIQILAGDDHH